MDGLPLPLEGVRVLDLGVVLAGTSATQILADLGAEVIRVESTQYFAPATRGMRAHPTLEEVQRAPAISGGYPDRDPGERPWNRFPWFNTTARNKLGMTVDLRREEGQDILRRLVALSDVLVTNVAPGTMDRLGVGYDALAAVNDRLIYVEASSFGSSGPYRHYRAYGPQVEGFAGHDLLRKYPDRDITASGWVVTADAGSAMAIALAAQVALYARRRTGVGQYVDVSLLENVLSLIGTTILDYTINGHVAESLGNRHFTAIQGCYRCSGDDRWLVLTISDDRGWAGLMRVLGDPQWGSEDRFATVHSRRRAHDEIDERITAWTSCVDRDDAVAQLREASVVAGPVLDDADAYADPHLAQRGYFVEMTQADTGTHLYPGMPYRFARAQLSVRHPPVRLGEHNEEIYRGLLGFTEEEYDQLTDAGHIGSAYADHIR